MNFYELPSVIRNGTFGALGQHRIVPIYDMNTSTSKLMKFRVGGQVDNMLKLQIKFIPLKIDAQWKVTYVNMFNSTPRKLRKTIDQINKIRSHAKLMTSIFGK